MGNKCENKKWKTFWFSVQQMKILLKLIGKFKTSKGNAEIWI